MIVKGQKINERYEIIKSIGEGGMANVYLGYDTILDRNVAIKVLRGDLSNDEKFVRRFQREALSASSLSHPNIVEMYDVGEDDGLYYIVMEYIEGKTLKQLLKKRGSLTLSEAIDIMLQMTDGMAHAHDSYIIHRDLKPQNIMIQDDGQIKITDFGIAMALNSTQLTQTNSVMGSVHYLPPEQAAGKGSSIRSDIYSMGIIFYELLSGSLPFKGESAVEIALKQMRDPLPSLREENKEIPQSIENIILKSTAKNPKNRYHDAKEMHQDLLTALNDERMNEPIYQYPYSEHEVDDTTKVVKTLSEEAVEDEQIAKPIVDDEVKKTNKWIWILSGIVGVIILTLLTIFFIVPAVTKDPDVKVPDVKDMTVIKAEEALKKVGFEVAVKTKKQASSTVKKGRIIKTDPAAGRTIKRGTKITLYESTGKEKYEMDDFVGNTDVQAVKKMLESEYKLTVIITKEEEENYDRKYSENEILKQEPLKGTELEEGDTVTFYVPNIVVYPDMTNWFLEGDNGVRAFADKYGITLNVVEQEVSSTTYSDGQVINQGTASGTQVVTGRTLTVTVAKKVAKPTEDDKVGSDDKTNQGTTDNTTPDTTDKKKN